MKAFVRMIQKFEYQFDELLIDQNEIIKLLGFEEGVLPEPFDRYLKEALADVHDIAKIQANYIIVEDVKVEPKCESVHAGGLEFKVGRLVCGELKNSEKLAFFVCTAGEAISKKSSRLLKGEDPVLGYVYDLLGSAIADAAGDKMQTFLKEQVTSSGSKITNRYSPGYCNWDVVDQHKLFSFFGDSPCGVTLTPSALMHPVKSISGVIGIGKEVRYREYQCTLCGNKTCVYRRVRGNRED